MLSHVASFSPGSAGCQHTWKLRGEQGTYSCRPPPLVSNWGPGSLAAGGVDAQTVHTGLSCALTRQVPLWPCRQESLTRITHKPLCCFVVTERVVRAMLGDVIFTFVTDTCDISLCRFHHVLGNWRWLLCMVGLATGSRCRRTDSAPPAGPPVPGQGA